MTVANGDNLENLRNAGALNIPFFTPAQVPAAGTPVGKDDHTPVPDIKSLPLLFRPFKLRGLEFHNRIILSPMCQFSADPEQATPTLWHITHLGDILKRGPSLAFVEATAVEPRGRISPHDLGLWSDDQITAYKQLTDFAHSQNQKIAIQIAHAGRKSSIVTPWIRAAAVAPKELGGWPDDVVGPTGGKEGQWSEAHAIPRALTTEEVEGTVIKFKEAAIRAVKAGFDVVEIHAAHGYLIHEFLSPATNKRKDKYGGSFENRIRFLIEIVDAVNSILPDNVPLLVRVSATDWLEYKFSSPEEASKHSWTVEQTTELGKILQTHKVDLLDVSSGGNHSEQKIPRDVPFFQAKLAKICREALLNENYGIPRTMLVSAVGGIKKGVDAENILEEGWADVIMTARQFLRSSALVWDWSDELGVDVKTPNQIGYMVNGFRGWK